MGITIEAHALLYILKKKDEVERHSSYMMRALTWPIMSLGNEILVPQMIALRIAGILYLLGVSKAKNSV
ncbi:MAG: hypothetical protein IPI30_21555 [Saprospiraceae bacterium]|nr:hypothetical protein [Candidatus Vicinibacter affinis]